jgi:hypothetical protein
MIQHHRGVMMRPGEKPLACLPRMHVGHSNEYNFIFNMNILMIEN